MCFALPRGAFRFDLYVSRIVRRVPQFELCGEWYVESLKVLPLCPNHLLNTMRERDKGRLGHPRILRIFECLHMCFDKGRLRENTMRSHSLNSRGEIFEHVHAAVCESLVRLRWNFILSRVECVYDRKESLLEYLKAAVIKFSLTRMESPLSKQGDLRDFARERHFGKSERGGVSLVSFCILGLFSPGDQLGARRPSASLKSKGGAFRISPWKKSTLECEIPKL